MRLGTHDATFYGGLKHATTLNRFFFPRSLNLDSFLKNSTSGTQSLKNCEIISVVKIWCVCFRAIFQFARSASVRSSHVAFSSRMPCRFGVTQRFWISMLMSFWLIYPMFFVGVILSSVIPIKIYIWRTWFTWIHPDSIYFPGGGGTLGIPGWGCAAGTLEPLTYTRASSAEFCYPILE